MTPSKKKTAKKKSTKKKGSTRGAGSRKKTPKKTTTRASAAKKKQKKVVGGAASTKKKASSKKASTKKTLSAKKASSRGKSKAKASSKGGAKKAGAAAGKSPRATPKLAGRASKASTSKSAGKAPSKLASPAPASPSKKPTAVRIVEKTQPTARAVGTVAAGKKPSGRASKRVTRSSVKQVATQAVELPVAERPTEELWILYRKTRERLDKRETQSLKAELEDLRNILMERHYPLVKYIAERLLQTLPKSIELDDLISAGLFGLMDAIRGFDPDRGIKFKTYCTTRIRGSILDQLRSQDWVPRLVRLKASRIDKALQRLTGEYGREPTHAELAEALELDHTELSKEMSGAHAKSMYSLSDKWEDRDDDSSMEKVDVLEDKKATDPVGELNRNDMMMFITRSLTHKERFIIEQYYQVGHTMREIGEMLALTESRVCQIHSNVMGRLKSLFGQKQTAMLM